MNLLWKDLKFAARMLAKTPGFTAVALVTLTLAIGANTAIVSIVNGMLIQPLPFPDQEELVQLMRGFKEGGLSGATSVPKYAYWQENTRDLFDGVAAFDNLGSGFNMAGDGKPERIIGSRATHEFFGVFGAAPVIGRGFRPEEDRPGAAKVVVLSHGLWTRRFAGDRGIVGKTLQLNGEAHTVVGVAPQGFKYPAAGRSGRAGDRRRRARRARGWPRGGGPADRLHSAGADAGHGPRHGPLSPMNLVVKSEKEVPNLAAAVQKEIWAVDAEQPVNDVRLMEEIVTRSLGRQRFAALLLGGLALLALLLAGVGIYGVLSYLVMQRTREIGVRMALGASARNVLSMVVRQGFLSVIIGVAIGVAGAFALARFLGRQIAGLLAGGSATDPVTFVLAPAVLAAVALLASVIPAHRASQMDPLLALRRD